MQRCLCSQLGHNLHVYVEDLVVKTIKADPLLADLKETFTNLGAY